MKNYPLVSDFLTEMVMLRNELESLRRENKHLKEVVEIQRETIKIYQPAQNAK